MSGDRIVDGPDGKRLLRIQTPTGKHVTRRQYLARHEALRDPPPCVYGHFDCAAWEGGPCSNEIAAELEAEAER